MNLLSSLIACPVCAGNDKGGYGVVVAIGVMIVFPFLVAFTVSRVLRRAVPPNPPTDIP